MAQTGHPLIRIAELEIEPAELDRYKALLGKEIEASVANEPGVLMLYALSVRDSPGQIRIIEVYADQDAYEAHLQTSHFLDYKRATAGMVRSLRLIETDPIPQNILDIGVVNDTTYGIATSTNAWGLFTNPVLLEQAGVSTRVQTAISMGQVAEAYIPLRAIRHMEKGRVVIFGAGAGMPYFSTDTVSLQRALETRCSEVLMGKNGVDAVYTADPRKDPSAERLESVTYTEALQRQLAVMDAAAFSLAMENRMPMRVFGLDEPGNVTRALLGETIGTLVTA